MVSKRNISVLGAVSFAAGLAAGCIGTRSDDLPVSPFAARVAPAAEAARVVRVIDADTYVMLSGSSTYRLRLLGADAPEQDQAFGPQATDSVARLLAPGRVVLVARAGLDLYGRTLGAVLLPSATVAAAGRAVPLDSILVARGWAWAAPAPSPLPGWRGEKAWPSARSSRWPRNRLDVACGNAALAKRCRRSCGGPSKQKASGATGLTAPGSKVA